MPRERENRPTERAYTFKYFEERLSDLRNIGSEEIVGTIRHDSLPANKEENFKACLNNFKERSALLYDFRQHFSKEEKDLDCFINKHKEDKTVQVEVMQKKRMLKNVQIFLQTIEAEREREEYYKKIAIEKYMAVHLEVTTDMCS
ncbi:hypothetical protein PoB_002822300 [Plakobranchus ocellatus]|uniref:Biogenesis of lysosome-related organelles complex 1 subunit 5 n=1 Tax=Plakobranchus ocellatus TaxID=259542 RepID=A0AAV4A3F8_9GAST|nr:hypothetical protein PoB_002822300 [Plakobranchus ocellatus]